jgi:hypothetical protein
MGSHPSRPASKQAVSLHGRSEEIILLMLPVYYNDAPLSMEERELAARSWSLVLNGNSESFIKLSKNPKFPHQNCIIFFYNSFYSRLFDVHPLAKDLFKDMNSQGRFLVKMISLAFSEHEDPEKFHNTLVKLAEIHNDRGVKAVECKLCPREFQIITSPTLSTHLTQMEWSEKCFSGLYVRFWDQMTMILTSIAYGSRFILACSKSWFRLQ